MTPATFEMDNYMPDWTDDFDFGAFLNLPPDDDDQGGEDDSTAWFLGGSRHTPSLMPELPDEQRIDEPVPSYTPTFLGPSESSEARQSTITQSQTNNASPAIKYAAGNSYGDETGADGCFQPAYSTVLKTTGSEAVAMGDCGEAVNLPSIEEAIQDYPTDLTNNLAPLMSCTCVSCLQINTYSVRRRMCNRGWSYWCRVPSCQKQFLVNIFGPSQKTISELLHHEKSHFGQPGKYACPEPSCQAVTKNFGDLKRHIKAKHCTHPDKEQFPCPVIWGKYSGNNGFARKDKLKSHYKNVHEGKPGPAAKAGRVIKPATLKPQVSSLGGSAGKQKE